jgi:oligogalacturonide lyase
MALTRRAWIFGLLPGALVADLDRRKVFPSEWRRFADPATEFEVFRLTDPSSSSLLPPNNNRSIGRRNGFLLFASDRPDGDSTGFQAYRMELEKGEVRRLTDFKALDPGSMVLLPSERGFVCFDGPSLMMVDFSNLRAREIYRIPDGWTRPPGVSISLDSLYLAFTETRSGSSRIQLLTILSRSTRTLVETSTEISAPLIRPRRAQICYREKDTALWSVDFTGSGNRRLRTPPGRIGPALWSPRGRTLLYLHYPEDTRELNAIRELTPDENQDKIVSKTSQFVHFGCNTDTSVFVGASRNAASPHILILVRSVRRELTVCEHKASSATLTTPTFSPDSQRIYFVTDRDGKAAIYQMRVDKLVEKTEEDAMDEKPPSDDDLVPKQ